MISATLYRERHLRARAVYRARTGVYEMRDLAIAALLEHLQKAEDIRRDVRVGSLQGVPHTGLCGHVNHPIEAAAIEQLIHDLGVRERRAHELEVAKPLEDGEARLLEAHVVVVVDRI